VHNLNIADVGVIANDGRARRLRDRAYIGGVDRGFADIDGAVGFESHRVVRPLGLQSLGVVKQRDAFVELVQALNGGAVRAFCGEDGRDRMPTDQAIGEGAKKEYGEEHRKSLLVHGVADTTASVKISRSVAASRPLLPLSRNPRFLVATEASREAGNKEQGSKGNRRNEPERRTYDGEQVQEISVDGMDVLEGLFERHFKTRAEEAKPLQGQLGGSGRAIVRLTGAGKSAIGIVYPVREENIAFIEFSRHFRRKGLPVPEIYAENLSQGAYLEEDLGDTTLFEFLSAHRQGETIAPEVVEAYRKTVAALPRFQVEAGKDLNYRVCYPRASFDRQSIAWDLNYFKYYFLRLAGIPFNEQALEADFGRLTKFLLGAPHEYFLYRDFQSRNVMLRGGEPWFLDYQGGRRGALQYDIASLLYDGKADLPPALRQELLDYYLEQLGKHIDVKRDAFMEHYYAYVYVRILQALGAYGFRGFYERKAHFLQSVPYALKNIEWLAANVKLPVALPALLDALGRLTKSEKLQGLAAPANELTVRVFSFSFHREAPKDESGNGGGFVFDARALPNPGREDRFRPLTGKDAPVAEYLREQESVGQFLASAETLVDESVRAYQKRGFSDLMVSFGCTGGQHRSVYLAEQLAKHLRAVNGVNVALRHVELEKMGR
jgi:aminoglycoside/choline kinase family phosphotransferase